MWLACLLNASVTNACLTRHRQLMLYLQLDVLGDAVAPQSRAVLSRGLALEDLDIARPDDFPVDVGEHPRDRRMTQNRVDLTHAIAGDARVDSSDNRFQQGPPIGGRGSIVRGRTRHAFGPSGLVDPKRQAAHIWAQADGRGCVGTADSGAAHREPIIAAQVSRLNELERRPACTWPLRLNCCHSASQNNAARQAKLPSQAVASSRYLPGVFPCRLPLPKQHVTEKPLDIAREVVRLVPAGGVVCDLFAGSGTFLAAAREAGLHWVGSESNQAYHAISSARLDATTDDSGVQPRSI
ncbi:DNA methylase [Burkholderia pseudomallei]|nr:DNA methylase [Burkholderia pseudomallei]